MALARSDRNKLRQLLSAHFSDSDLRTLCFELKIDYENLPGQTKVDKVRELITYCERSKMIADLLLVCRAQRPTVEWPSELKDDSPPGIQGLSVLRYWWLIGILIVLLAAGSGLVDWLDFFNPSEPTMSATRAITPDSLIPAPVANFTFEKFSLVPGGGIPVTVQFFDESTGTITGREWNFGDGSTSLADSPEYTYTKIGVYDVTLLVSGPGGSHTSTQTFSTITPPLEPVTWRILLSNGNKGETIATRLNDWSPGSTLNIQTAPDSDSLVPILSTHLQAGDPPELLLLSRSELVIVLNSEFVTSLVPLDDLLATSNYPATRLEPARVEGRVYGVPYGDDYLLHPGSPSQNVIGFLAYLTQMDTP